ncbi:hypothetical protein B0H34DRAFT_618371, partial [Crassisporium funariophilum]
RFNIHWIASHRHILGNKLADKEATKAAQEGSLPTGDLPPALQKALPISIHAAKRQHMKDLQLEWKREWLKSQQKLWFASNNSEFPFTKHREIVSMVAQS